MTCDDYLAMLETLPLEELGYGPARDHAALCHDCNRVTRVVAERERSMILAMGDVRSSITSTDLAHDAVMLARRRRVVGYYRIGLGIAAAAALMFVAVSRVTPRVSRARLPLIEQMFPLECLSPDQAAALLRTHVRDPNRVSIVIRPPVGIIRVVAPEDAMDHVRALIDEFDNGARTKCAAQVPVPRD